MRSMLLALQFLTCMPINIKGDIGKTEITDAIIYFPAIGAIHGLLLFALKYIFSDYSMEFAVGLVLVTAEFILTRGLHFDGLADLADGWYASRDREVRLRVMKDSNIGVMGALALILVVLFKVALLPSICASIWNAVLYGVGAKFVIVCSVVFFPYARKYGTGHMFCDAKSMHLAYASVIPLIMFFVVRGLVVVVTVGSIIATLGIGRLISIKLNGLTGDCYGTLHELFQVFFLIVLGGTVS